MRALLVAVALITSLCSTAIGGPQEEALQVLEKWTKAFTDSDVDGIVKLYASDALFLGTSSKTVVVKSEEIRKYFERALLNNRPRGATLDTHSDTVLSDTVVVVTGLDTLTEAEMESQSAAMVASHLWLRNAAQIGKLCISIGQQCPSDTR
jgi:uncharacterized protein (TIGR02246 family)